METRNSQPEVELTQSQPEVELTQPSTSVTLGKFDWSSQILLIHRRVALNILQNHFDECVRASSNFPRFKIDGRKLRIEDFLLKLIKCELPPSSRVIEHFRRIKLLWPVGTVCWEHLPEDKNPYFIRPETREKIQLKIEADEREENLRACSDQLEKIALLGWNHARKGLDINDIPEELSSHDILRKAWEIGFKLAGRR